MLAIAVTAVPISAAAAAQQVSDYALTVWTAADGPFTGDAWAIAQDHDGFLWFGTPNGLVRFDGVTFVAWPPSRELPVTRITALCAARDGSLWIGFGLREGVTRLRKGRLDTYSVSDGLMGGYVTSLIQDRDGLIWAGGPKGLSVFREGTWTRVPLNEAGSDDPVSSLYQDRTGSIWVGASNGVFVRHATENRFALFSSLTQSVRSFTEDDAGEIWVTDAHAGLRPLREKVQNERTARRAGGISVAADRHGALWVGTLGGGLLHVRPVAGVGATDRIASRKPTVETLTSAGGLPSDFVRCVFLDRDGNVWFGMQGGLGRLSERTVSTVVAGRDLNHGFIRGLAVTTDGGVWLSFADGLSRLLHDRWTRVEHVDALARASVSALASSPDGSLWVATDSGVLRYVNGRVERLPRETRLANVTAMSVDHERRLWICDYARGVFSWDGAALTRVPDLPGPGVGYAVITDSTGRTWVGLADGGVVAYENGRKIASYTSANGLAEGTINTIYEDRTGTVWIGTTAGLSRIRNGRVVPLPRLPFVEHGVLSILDDDQGFLWFGVFSGLIRVPLTEFDGTTRAASVRYQRFDESDGLQTSPRRITFPSAARDASGMLWFLTQRGAVVVNPRIVRGNHPAPTVSIENVSVNDQDQTPRSDQRLGPHIARLRIDYTAPSLAGSARTRFRYRLEGLDTGWIDAGTRRQAFYTNLAPGTYRFLVAAENDGIWNEASTVWGFVLLPAFYQTSWFRALIAILFASVLAILWLLRERHLRERYSIVLAERSRLGRELHDTLLQGLFGIALQLDAVVELLSSSPDLGRESLGRVRGHVEGYIRETRHSIWNLRSPSLTGGDLPTAIQRTGQTLVSGTPIRFSMAVRGQPTQVRPEVEEQVLRIAQEAISNAVRHSGAAEIHGNLTYRRGALKLQVTDNGHGMYPPTETNGATDHGFGFCGMYERARQVGGELRIKSDSISGTVVEFTCMVEG